MGYLGIFIVFLPKNTLTFSGVCVDFGKGNRLVYIQHRLIQYARDTMYESGLRDQRKVVKVNSPLISLRLPYPASVGMLVLLTPLSLSLYPRQYIDQIAISEIYFAIVVHANKCPLPVLTNKTQWLA